jgi:16S rRNA (cytidine1402-2'-O)-methyltransferase
VAIARELTKIHEEVVRGSVSEVLEHWPDAEVRGEVVVVVAGAASSEIAASTTPDAAAVRAALAARLEAGDSVRDAAARVAAELGVSRRDAYGAALLLRPGSPA